MKLKHLRNLLVIPIFFNLSCTAYKQVPYFQDLRRDTLINEKINNFSALTLQPGDLLGISVTSLNRQADLIFNYNLNPEIRPQRGTEGEGSSGAGTAGVDQNRVFGYLVDQEGNINLPLIGVLGVVGLTTKEVSTQLESKLKAFLSKPNVNVRILNFKISVLGDVKNPGSFGVQNEKISLLEAISLAGDLNTTGLRNNVLLVREIEGKREYVTLDLKSKKIFNSPYFYLKNNDILYVTPNRAKVSSSEVLTSKIGVIVSSLALLIIILKK